MDNYKFMYYIIVFILNLPMYYYLESFLDFIIIYYPVFS